MKYEFQLIGVLVKPEIINTEELQTVIGDFGNIIRLRLGFNNNKKNKNIFVLEVNANDEEKINLVSKLKEIDCVKDIQFINF